MKGMQIPSFTERKPSRISTKYRGRGKIISWVVILFCCRFWVGSPGSHAVTLRRYSPCEHLLCLLSLFLLPWQCSQSFKPFTCSQGPQYLLTSSSKFPTGVCWVGLLGAQNLLGETFSFSQGNIAKKIFSPNGHWPLPGCHYAGRVSFALFLPMTDRGGIRKEEGGGKNPILSHMYEKTLPRLHFSRSQLINTDKLPMSMLFLLGWDMNIGF